jgi:hypothetical protein
MGRRDMIVEMIFKLMKIGITTFNITTSKIQPDEDN